MSLRSTFIISLCLVVCLALRSSQAFRILLVGPSFFPSLQLQLQSIGGELTRRNHQVYSAIASNNKMKNKTTLAATSVTYEVPILADEQLAQVADNLERWLVTKAIANQVYSAYSFGPKLGLLECEAMLEDKQFFTQLALLSFDMAVVHRYEPAPCYYLIPYLLKIPYVSVSAHYMAYPALNPVSWLYPISEKMTFPQRLLNMITSGLFRIFTSPILFNHSLLERYAPHLHSYTDLQDASQITFVLSDHMLNWPIPTMPNVILAGAITSNKKLPENFERIVNQSTEYGIIVVSFGSIGSYLPHEILVKMFTALSHFNQTIIFRLGSDSLNGIDNIPPNIHIFSWIPQSDLLAHSNTKLFITHCGNNGQYEAVYHGVPMIGFPLFGDQKFNAFRIKQREYGLILDVVKFTPQELIDSMKFVLDNDKYSRNVKKASAILHDSIMKPGETISYWIEHILRHGHGHLVSHSDNYNWYQFYSFDTIGFLGCSIIAGWCITSRILQFFIRRLFGKK